MGSYVLYWNLLLSETCKLVVGSLLSCVCWVGAKHIDTESVLEDWPTIEEVFWGQDKALTEATVDLNTSTFRNQETKPATCKWLQHSPILLFPRYCWDRHYWRSLGEQICTQKRCFPYDNHSRRFSLCTHVCRHNTRCISSPLFSKNHGLLDCVAINYREDDKMCFFLAEPGYVDFAAGYTTALVNPSGETKPVSAALYFIRVFHCGLFMQLC